MKVYNEDKTEILLTYNLDFGRLVSDKIVKEILPAQEEIKPQGHYEVVREYPNGGKDVKWVFDVLGQPAREETPVYEDILVYIPYTAEELNEIDKLYEKSEEEILDDLRFMRENECFSVLSKVFIVDGKSMFWFETLTPEQKVDAEKWVQEWRDVTKTKVIPIKPIWLK
jgi:hypothetical protein